MNRRVMCLCMPWLPIEQQAADGTAARHEPLALIERVDSRERVWCCNAAAARGGVRSGMPLTEARAVLPELTVAPHDPQGDRLVLQRLAGWAQCLSPVVQPAAPDSLLVDVTGCERLFRGESNLLRLGITGLASQGFTAWGAIADTVGAAWALAHGQREPTVVAPGETAAALASLPPWALRLSRAEAATLDAVGVRKIETLLCMPRSSMAARLGDGVSRRLDQALGRLPELIEPWRPPAEPVSRIRFAGATDRLDVLYAAIDRLLSFFCEQLARRVIGVRGLLCTLYHEDVPPTTVEIGLSRATRSAKHLHSLLLPRLEATPPAAPVCAMMLWTRATFRVGDAQPTLFEPYRVQEEEAVAGLVDRLTNRLGAEAVVHAKARDDHQPEYAYRYVPAIESARSGRSRDRDRERDRGRDCAGADASARGRRDIAARAARVDQRAVMPASCASTNASAPRPLRLLPRPIEVRAMAIVPDGPPTWFRWDGVDQVIVEAVGPERIETGWWREDDVQRDYFAVRAETGARFWMFRDRRGGRWFVHGRFD